MGAAGFAERTLDGRQRVDDGLVGGDFAIQHAQGIGFGAALAIAAHGGRFVLQFLAEFFDVLRAAVVIAHGIEQQFEPGEADALENFHHHFYDFGIDQRRIGPDGFGADLKELAVAALLRALAAEHGAEVVELLHAGALVQAMLDIGADHGRGVFWA